MKNKWSELDNLDLNGFACYMKEPKKNKIFYYFYKKTEGGWLNIKSEFDNIEWQLKNGWTVK